MQSPVSGSFEFLSRLETLLNKLPLEASVILTGDLNINSIDKGRNLNYVLTNILFALNLHMHVESDPRISRYSSFIMDYVCSNLNFGISFAE